MNEQESKFSRRDFFKGAVASGVAATTVGLMAACSPQAKGKGNDTPLSSTGDIAWDVETDVLVVGFGAAGASAAIEAKRGGAEVTIVETTEAGGGSTVLCGGFIYLGGTPLQEQLGVKDSVEETLKYMTAAAGPYANQEALKIYCENGPDTYQFCIDCGIKFGENLDLNHGVSGRAGIGLAYSGNELQAPYRDIAVPAPQGHSTGDACGKGIFEPMKKTVEAEGIQVVYGANAERLIRDETGRVIGAEVTCDGKQQYFRAAKAVILAGGGFTMNRDMIDANNRFTTPFGGPIGNPNELGTCIKMGQEVGADLFGMSQICYTCFIYGTDTSTAKAILVDKTGRRIISETSYGSWVGEALMANGPEAYLVFDSALKGSFDGSGDSPEFEAGAIAGATEFEAGTITELAEQLGIDPLSLENTVALYNTFAEQGEDGQFGKEPEYLAPIATPPFYARPYGSESAFYTSEGGLKTDVESHVISVSGDVIPGLYAAGRCSSLIYGHYMGSGTSIADCITFGRIAGQNAAAETA